MSIKRKALATAMAGAIGLGVAPIAQSSTLTSLVITSGTFAMGVFTPTPNTITNFGGQNIVGTTVAANGTGVSQGGALGSSIIAWDFNGGGTWVNTFSTATSSGGVEGSAITASINLYDNWNGTNFFQGTTGNGTQLATGTATGTATSGTYTLSWQSLIVGGPFNNQIGTYNVSGTYGAQVPVPAAAWLMGSGLIGLVGVARRRKKTA